ncbi:MAG: hypothetical protein JNL97_01800, partial [Verrucomicrobiales bacterium]|nr:hypothetical protein [Verrucomicrobiales bacterium]
FVGRIDEVRLWNRVLSDDELARLPRSRVTGTEPGLYARWSMEAWTSEPTGKVCWSDGARRLPATLRGRARAVADETAVQASYDAPWWLEGTVRGPDGTPAIAEISWLERDSRAWHIVTDSEGRFRWRGLRKPDSDRLRIVAGNLGVLARMELRSGDRVRKDWVLDALPSVEGQVLRWDGVARPGVRVRLRPSDPRAPHPPDGWMARTGPDGRFAFPAITDGEYDVECDSRRDPFAGATASADLRERVRVRRSEGPARVLFRVSTTGEDRVWRRFTRRDGLPDNTISTMAVDDLGALWVGTPGGLARYDGARFTTWTRGDGLPGESVTALTFDREGGLWVAGDEGLARRTGDRFERLTVVSAAPELTVFDMACSGDGALWLATDRGVHRHQSGTWKAFGTGDGLPASHVFSIWPDAGNSVRVLTRGGLWARLSDRGLEPCPADRWLPWGLDPLFCREVRMGTNSMSRDGWIWKRHNHPLRRGDGVLVGGENLDVPGLPDVRGILEVPGRETWVATQHQGLLRFGADATRSLTAAQGLPSARVLVTLRARDGDLWIGTAAGLVRWQVAGPTLFREADGLPGSEITDLLETPDGSIWVAGNRGIVRWVGGRLVAVPGVPGIPFARLGSDLRGGVWAFAAGVGIFRGDGAGLVPAHVDVLQPHVWSADFRVLSSGELCFASVSGL